MGALILGTVGAIPVAEEMPVWDEMPTRDEVPVPDVMPFPGEAACPVESLAPDGRGGLEEVFVLDSAPAPEEVALIEEGPGPAACLVLSPVSIGGLTERLAVRQGVGA